MIPSWSSILKSRLAAEEQRAKDSEAKIIQAAEHGKKLLEKNMALERDQRDYETVQQENHELNLRLQVVVENCTL